MVILDDYLDQALFLSIKASIEAASFPWEESMILSKKASAHLLPAENLQQVHGFFLRKPGIHYKSVDFDIISPIVERLNPVELIKVKLNRTTRKNRHIEYGLHVDTRRTGATTAIFYLNSNNGYTLFEDDEKVYSVANRMVLFDSVKLHTGASCTDAHSRLVLNLNMIMARDTTLGTTCDK